MKQWLIARLLVATWVSGLSILPVTTSMSAAGVEVMVPMGAEGQSYVFLTKDNSGNLTDSNIIAGTFISHALPKSSINM